MFSCFFMPSNLNSFNFLKSTLTTNSMPTLFMNSNECDCPAQTDFRLGEHEQLDKSELRHAGNSIEVSRHSTAKLNIMKTDKYNYPIKREVVDDNIKIEVLDEIATDKAKINF